MKSLVVLAAVLPAIAHAQPGVVEPEPRAIPVQVDTVDENVAVGLSLGGTVLSWGLLIAGGHSNNETMGTVGAIGTMFAPSFGHWYARSALTRGLGIRAFGLGVGLLGLAMAFQGAFGDSESTSKNNEGTASVLLLVGAGMYIAGTVDDIARAPIVARRYNSRFDNVTLVPQVIAHRGGVSVLGRF